MAKLSKRQIEHLANLARLKLSDKEKEIFSGQLSKILNYVSKVQKFVKNGEAEFQTTSLENVFRQDKVVNCEILPEDLLKNAPEIKDGFLKVPEILQEL